MVLHATDIVTYLKCGREFKFSQIERITRKEQVIEEGDEYTTVPLSQASQDTFYFTFGNAGHNALAEYHRQGNNLAAAVAKWQERAANFEHTEYQLGLHLLREYDAQVSKDNDTHYWEVVMLETPLTFEIIPGVTLMMTVDLLERNKFNGQYRVVDHKFYSSFKKQENLENDLQFLIYSWGLWQSENVIVNSVLINQLRKYHPSSPKVLATGKLSQDKAQLCTATEYRAIAQALAPATWESDYGDFIAHLEARENPWIRRDIVVYSEAMFRGFTDYLKNIVRSILSQDILYPRPSGMNCNYCHFLPLCRMEREGNSYQNFMNIGYRYKTEEER